MDPTCGSGRNLISFHVAYPGNYLYGEDIDKKCCLMTVANMIIHGGVGEVVWHDSLWPDSWYGGWKVNEYLNKPLGPAFGIPHVRTIKKEQSYIWRSWEARRIQVAEEREKQTQPASEPKVMTLADDSVIVVGQSTGLSAKVKKKSKKDKSSENGQLSLFD